MKIDRKEIVKNREIYPRKNETAAIVESYVQSLIVGDAFPPMEVQRVKDEEKEWVTNIDGWHRDSAIEQYNTLVRKAKKLKKEGETEGIKLADRQVIQEVEVTFWKKDVLEWTTENIIKMKLRGAFRNSIHGKPLTKADREDLAVDIINLKHGDIGKGLLKQIANALGRSPTWISNNKKCKERIQYYRAIKESLILELDYLGWNQQQIASHPRVNLHQTRIGQVLREILELKNLLKTSYEKGTSVEDLATAHKLSQRVIWAIILDGKTDDEIFEEFGQSDYSNDLPKIYDVWNFTTRDPRFSSDYPGFLFGQVLMNVLYRCGKNNPDKPSLVIDPMAGGGSTIDACLIMGRECLAYDIKPTEDRKGTIKQHDIRQGYPEETKDCDIIFLDPPYFKKKEEDYNCPEIMSDRDTFISFMSKLANDSFNVVKKGGHVALIYGNYIDYIDPTKSIFGAELFNLFTETGFRPILAIQTPLSGSAQYEPTDMTYAREHGRILTISRDLYIFRRPE